MKYFLIAGEASGDQHAGELMKALAGNDKEAVFEFLGGEAMAETAGRPVVHIREMAFMGFTQVIANLGRIRKNFKAAKRAIINFNPDVLILIDYPGFNMRMAAWAKKRNIRIHYYIPPAIWAWNTGRVKKVRRYCDRVFTILPFEKDFYKRYDLDVDYVGNPVFESISRKLKTAGGDGEKPNQIALLPGSRKQEIQRLLPVMLSVIPYFPDHKFVIAAMETHRELYKSIIGDRTDVNLVYNNSLQVLENSVSALVTSGTATLETALMSVPQLVCYKTGYISYRIAKKLIKVPFISLVNLIVAGPAIPELIQANCKTDYLKECLHTILPGGPNHEDQLEIAGMVREKIGDPEVSEGLAGLIIKDLASLG